MVNNLYQAIEDCPVIAAVKDEEGINRLLALAAHRGAGFRERSS